MSVKTQGSLDEYAAFIAVAKFESFTLAAKATGVSSPVLSRRVRTLETRLKTELLLRTTRSVHLTSTGKRLYEQIKSVPDLVTAAEEEILMNQGRSAGSLKMIVASYIAHLPRFKAVLCQFLEDHPSIQITLEVHSRPKPGYEKTFDIILTGKLPMTSFPDSSVRQKKLFGLQGAMFASPTYIAKHGKPSHPNELIEHNCLSYLNRNWTFCSAEGESFSVNVGGNITSNDDRLLHTATLSGLGITYAFPEFFEQSEENGSVVRILDEYTMNSYIDVYAVMPEQNYVPQALKLLIEVLQSI